MDNVDSETARLRLDRLREEYEPNAQALVNFLALELPPWFRREQPGAKGRSTRDERGSGRDLVGSPASRRGRAR